MSERVFIVLHSAPNSAVLIVVDAAKISAIAEHSFLDGSIVYADGARHTVREKPAEILPMIAKWNEGYFHVEGDAP